MLNHQRAGFARLHFPPVILQAVADSCIPDCRPASMALIKTLAKCAYLVPLDGESYCPIEEHEAYICLQKAGPGLLSSS